MMPRAARRRRIAWLISAALCAGLCAPAARSTAGTGNAAGTTALVAADDRTAAAFVLPDLDGERHALAQFRDRVVLVHFFATWCEPCREEMVSLRRLQSRLADRPFAVLAISVAEADSAVRRFFAGDTPPCLILLDRDRSVARAWNVDTLPVTLVLDRALKPRFIAQGDVDWTRPDVMKILTDLLSEASG
jgi:thiol-disulfide isomerase/thioredoxin